MRFEIYIDTNLFFIQCYYNYNAISANNVEERTYGTNEMFTWLNILIRMFAKPSTVEIILSIW